ncbi:MAG: hypothetical protein RR190_03275 [Bacteroidales bacterium]
MKIFVLLISLLLFCGSSSAQEPKPVSIQMADSASRPLQYYLSVRPMVAVASFGSKDFRQNIKSITGESISDVQWGFQIQAGIYVHKRWNVGLEYSMLRATNSIHKFPIYSYNSLYGGVYGMYNIVQRSKFILSAKLAFGLGYSSLLYNKDIDKNEVTMEDFIDQSMLNGFKITQKALGYAALGIHADWVAYEGLRFGGFVEWTQQIGEGKWYTANAKTLISDLPKSSFTPLHIGISITLGF